MGVLTGRALEHWSRKGGPGRAQALPGSIFAVLNPALTGRAKAVRIGFESQLLKLGMCPSFALCKAKNPDGLECREPYNHESGCEYCPFHAAASPWERQNQRLPPAPQARSRSNISLPVGSRPVASPITGPTLGTPDGAALVILQRAEAELEAL